jgi:hypothetical protein
MEETLASLATPQVSIASKADCVFTDVVAATDAGISAAVTAKTARFADAVLQNQSILSRAVRTWIHHVFGPKVLDKSCECIRFYVSN